MAKASKKTDGNCSGMWKVLLLALALPGFFFANMLLNQAPVGNKVVIDSAAGGGSAGTMPVAPRQKSEVYNGQDSVETRIKQLEAELAAKARIVQLEAKLVEANAAQGSQGLRSAAPVAAQENSAQTQQQPQPPPKSKNSAQTQQQPQPPPELDQAVQASKPKCRRPKHSANRCDAPILHPDMVQDYKTFTHLMVEGLKLNCHGGRRGKGGGGSSPLQVATDSLIHEGDVGPNKWYLEFGAARGATARHIGRKLESLDLDSGTRQFAKLHSFDCFMGLPEHWKKGFNNQGFLHGAFTQKGKPPFTDPHVVWEVGYYNETLAPFVRRHLDERSHIVLLHVDPDIYSAAHTIFTELGPYIGHETLVPFHELMNYPSYRDGELLALWEWFKGPYGQCVEMLGGNLAGEHRVKEDWFCNERDPNYNCNNKPGSQGPEDQLIRVLAKEESAI